MTTPTTQAPSLRDSLEAANALSVDTQAEQAQAVIIAWRNSRMEALKAAFLQDNDAETLITRAAEVMDEIIRTVCTLLTPSRLGLAVVATGGYGRKELFPHSDIDLLFIYRPAARATAERVTRTLLYVLWDAGLKVGHALRGVDDTLALAREDITIRTGVLDARLVTGDAELFAELTQRFREEIVQGTQEEFIAKKLAEREERRARFGDSRYLLEPNIKEGHGALRDLHLIYWIARYCLGEDVRGLHARGFLTDEEFALHEKARAFYWRLRAHLHFYSGKAEERLTYDKQQVLSGLMGFRGRSANQAVERMMRRYFLAASSVGSLTRMVCAMLETRASRAQTQAAPRGFVLRGGCVDAPEGEDFTANPLRMLQLFQTAQALGADVHPHALRHVAHSLHAVDHPFRHAPEANAVFLRILLGPRPQAMLARMNEVGLLGRFVPAFGRIVARMQFNMYHVFTVDEHTLSAIGVLAQLEEGALKDDMPLASDVITQGPPRAVLYVAMLCHDIAKGYEGDHEARGAEMTYQLARRFGLGEADARLCAWLVGHHLAFTATAFKRDLAEARTIHDFAALTQSASRLRLLFLLTVADMRAVGPGVWNAWKATLLRNLFHRTEEYLLHQRITTGEREKDEVRAALRVALPEAAAEDYLAQADAEFIESLSPGAHVRLGLRLHAMRRAGGTLDVHVNDNELTVLTPDRPGLFALLSGVLSLMGANIAGARIATLKNGLAVDRFQLQDMQGRRFDEDWLKRLTAKMEAALAGKVDLPKELSRQKAPHARAREALEIQAQVYIENDASATHTVIEVVGRDRVGFLHAVTQALTQAGLTIGSAHISTYGAQVVDVFYVKDAFGMKLLHEGKQREVREALLSAAG